MHRDSDIASLRFLLKTEYSRLPLPLSPAKEFHFFESQAGDSA